MGAERIRRRVAVSGRVQGVYFRGSTEKEARARGVDGWVRNRPDGSVEAGLLECPFRVNFGLSRPTAATSAFRGEADEIGTKTDIGQRMSPVGG